MRQILNVVVLLLTSWLAAAPPARAQAPSATLAVTALDESGGSMPGVGLRLINDDTRLERAATTSAAGDAVFVFVPPGTYTLRAEFDGFAASELKQVVVNVGDDVTLNVRMKVAEVTGAVTVVADARPVERSASVGTVIDRQFVGNLPLNGRTAQALIELTPGVLAARTTYFTAGQFSVNGQRASTNYVSVDGASANIFVTSGLNLRNAAGGNQMGTTALGGTQNLASVEALQEFRIQTSTFAPEFGRTPGAQVSLVTRSGTNRISGALFEFFRDDALDATDWFVKRDGLTRPAQRMHDFGGVLGGPIVRDRTFFFASYEGLRLRQPQVATWFVPSMAVRSAAQPALRRYLEAIPPPNGRDFGNGQAEVRATFDDPGNVDAFSGRVDHGFTSSTRLFGRYSATPSSTTTRVGSQRSRNEVDTTTVTAGLTAVIGSRMTNEVRANWSRVVATTTDSVDGFLGAVPLDPAVVFPAGLSPADSTAGFAFFDGTIGWRIGRLARNQQRQLHLIDTHALFAGAHELKFGVDFRRLTPTDGPARGEFDYFLNDIGVATTGDPANTFVYNALLQTVDMQFDNLSVFAQDTWRLSPRATLTYGLRWDRNPAPTTDPYTPAILNFSDPSRWALSGPGVPTYRTRNTNVGPRVGLAYVLSDSPRWGRTLRAGTGLFYDLGSGPAGYLTISYPHLSEVFVGGVSIPAGPEADVPPLGTLPAGVISAVDPDLKTPRVYHYSASLEQALGAAQTLTVSYVGSRGRDLLYTRNLSVQAEGIAARATAATNDGRSRYNALQAQVQRRLSSGVQGLVSYTLARADDTQSDDGAQYNFGPPDTVLTPSTFDVRHAFSAAVSWVLPSPASGPARALLGGWSMDGILRARSATPFSVIGRVEPIGGFGETASLRADRVAGVPVFLDDTTAPGGRRLNAAAFTPGPPGVHGNTGRNEFRGFGMSQVDASVRRSFTLGGQRALQLRVDVFNVLNQVNFADPVGVVSIYEFGNQAILGRPLFGESTQLLGRSLSAGGGLNPLFQVGGPRSVQLSLRATF